LLTTLPTNKGSANQTRHPFIWPILPFVGYTRPSKQPFVGQNLPLMPNSRKHAGFTMIELLVTITIIGIVATLAIPSFRTFILNNRITTQTNEFIGALKITRNNAVSLGRNVAICAADPVTNGSACVGANWATGWLIFEDLDGDGGFDPGETIIRTGAALAGDNTLNPLVAGVLNNNQAAGALITYQPDGTVRQIATLASGNIASMAYSVCDGRGPAFGRAVIISRTGNTRIINPSPAC